MPYPLLSGRVNAVSTKTLVTPVVGASLLLALLIAAFLFMGRSPQPAASAASPPVPAGPVPRQDPGPTHNRTETTFHIENVRAQLLFGLEQVNRAQRLSASTLPELTRNGLWQERRRTEAALTASENAKHALDQALAELRVAIPIEKE
jgi:hypothetical protein